MRLVCINWPRQGFMLDEAVGIKKNSQELQFFHSFQSDRWSISPYLFLMTWGLLLVSLVAFQLPLACFPSCRRLSFRGWVSLSSHSYSISTGFFCSLAMRHLNPFYSTSLSFLPDEGDVLRVPDHHDWNSRGFLEYSLLRGQMVRWYSSKIGNW